jgi:hypothetical protein
MFREWVDDQRMFADVGSDLVRTEPTEADVP